MIKKSKVIRTSLGMDAEGALEQMVNVGRHFVIQARICVLEHDVAWEMLQCLSLCRVLYSLDKLNVIRWRSLPTNNTNLSASFSLSLLLQTKGKIMVTYLSDLFTDSIQQLGPLLRRCTVRRIFPALSDPGLNTFVRNKRQDFFPVLRFRQNLLRLEHKVAEMLLNRFK